MGPRTTRHATSLLALSLALSMALSLALGLACAFAPSTASAQAALGFGEDATVAAPGVVRVSIANRWARFDQIVNDGTGAAAVAALVRTLPLTVELGVLGRVSLAANVPLVHTQTNVTFESPRADGKMGYDSLTSTTRSHLGDVELTGKLVWLGQLGEAARFTPGSGIHLRSAVTAGYRLGTGALPDPADPFAPPMGTRARALDLGSESDLLIGHWFWMSIVGHYIRPVADHVVVRAAPTGDPLAGTVWAPVDAARQLGHTTELAITPRLDLGPSFLVGVSYRLFRRAEDRYTGVSQIALPSGDTATVDAATLDAGTGGTEQRLTFGVVYSTVAAYAQGHAPFAAEVTYRHTKTLSIPPWQPRPYSDAIGVRIYLGLWGAGERVRGR